MNKIRAEKQLFWTELDCGLIHQNQGGYYVKLVWLTVVDWGCWLGKHVGTCDWLGAPRGVGAADLAGWTESTSPSGPVTQRRGTGLSWPSTSHLTAQACTGAAGRRGRSTGRRRHCCRRPELVGDHRYGDSGHPRPSRGHLRVARGLTNSTGHKTRTGSTSGRGLPRQRHGQDEWKFP
jgi:hypothetical protein